MLKRCIAVAFCLCLALPLFAQEKEADRLKDAYNALRHSWDARQKESMT
jgi:hypothetical protein